MSEHAQFIHLYGELGARLDGDQSVYGNSRTRYLKFIEPFLFWGAEAHLVALEKIWVDRIVRIQAWRLYIDNLGNQLRDLTIAVGSSLNISVIFSRHTGMQATVLLNVNIAFLSIQSVDNNGLLTAHRSPTQILIYVSTVTSLSSMLFGLLLVRHSDVKRWEPSGRIVSMSIVLEIIDIRTLKGMQATFLGSMTHGARGLESLAIMYTLPYALLMWS